MATTLPGKFGGRQGLGRLRGRVRFESPVRSAGDTGQRRPEGWTDEGTVWAEIVEVIGAEQGEHDQQVPEHTHRISLRGVLHVLHDWRAIWNGRTFNVVLVTGAGTGIANGLVLLCMELPPSTET